MKIKILSLVMLLIVIANCKALLNFNESQSSEQTANTSKVEGQNGKAAKSEQPGKPVSIYNIFVKDDKLVLNGYEFIKLKKFVKVEKVNNPIEASYAILTKNKKLIATFDSTYHPMGNETNFGLFCLLGNNQKQAIVSQTIPQGGRYWAINLFPEFKIIFDSQDFGLSGEEIELIDLDKDGIYEISQRLTSFWGSFNMAMSESPLPRIIFKYDKTINKYSPANTQFQDYLLQGIGNEIKDLKKEDEYYLSKRLGILLLYIYSGKQDQGWEFFDREYKLGDKKEIVSNIKESLKKEPIYKILYKQK